MAARRHIALFMLKLEVGGVERSMLHLARALVSRGHRVDVVVCRPRVASGAYRHWMPPLAHLITLKAVSRLSGRAAVLKADPAAFGILLRPVMLALNTLATLRYLPDLARYLGAHRPDALVSALPYCNLAALWARRLSGVSTRVVVTEHVNLSRTIANPKKGRLWKWRFVLPVIHRAYAWADAIVAVSDGVADDLSARAAIARERIITIYNPVVDSELHELAEAPLGHPWFAPGSPPVLLSAGRLDHQKDFPTLLRAFARLRALRAARLLILGDGAERSRLQALARQLGIAGDLEMPGFVANPYGYMGRASAFVLSSAYEGLPGVLIEALACGCPVVSTDCPSGPREILAAGQYGRLVPVGDDAAMAEAIAATLDGNCDRSRLRARAGEFSVEAAATRYLELMFGQ